jgi:two-component system sensor histidine kinase MprB
MHRESRPGGPVSLRARVALLVATAVALVVAAVSVAAYITVRAQLLQQLDKQLIARANAAAASPLVRSPQDFRQVPVSLFSSGDVLIGLARIIPGQAVITPQEGHPPPVGSDEWHVAAGQDNLSIRTAKTDDGEFRVVAVPAAPGTAMVLAQSTAGLTETLERLRNVLLIVGAVGVVLAGLVGLAIARAGLRPVERLTEAAERVAITGKLEPIEVHGNDELARLAQRFNAMLEALGHSRDQQRQLVADAGHELRTPLTSLRTNLDLLAQSDERQAAGGPALPPADRDALLHDVRGQVEELSGLVGDLVELAREDQPATVVEPVELSEVTSRALERVRRRAPSLNYDVDLSPWTVAGDATALERAVTNLLDNAAKFSPPGGTVTVRLANGTLSVADQGPGISEDDLPHVFDRFYRSTNARSTPGSGLGLAIVEQVASRHGGCASAGRAPSGGALVTLALPGQPI